MKKKITQKQLKDRLDRFIGGPQSRTGYLVNPTIENQTVIQPEINPDGNTDQAPNLEHLPLSPLKVEVMRTSRFTVPQIYRGEKEWFVSFYYQNPHTGAMDRHRMRAGINYLASIEEKEQAALFLQMQVLQKLKAGKVPKRYIITPKENKDGLIKAMESIAASEALGKSVDTARNYNLSINRLRKYLDHIGQPEMILRDFTEEHAQKFKEFLIKEQLSNVSINCNIQPLKTFLQKLFRQKKIEINPFIEVKYLPKHRGSTFIAFDASERKIIAEELRANYPELYLFANLIYSCFTRPIENCALRSNDFDTNLDWLQIRVETSKVSHTSFRQIMPGLRELLQEYNIRSMPKNKLIFESICGTSDNVKARRKKVTELWNKVVIRKLGIKKEMYGLKHTGNIDYLKQLDNIGDANLIWLQRQNDHTSLDTTQKYIRDLGVYKMKSEFLPFGRL